MSTQTTISNTDVEIFSGEVQKTFAIMDPYGANSSRYFAARPGEVLNQPIVAHGDGRFFADGQDHTTWTSSEMTAEEIPLFTPFKARDAVNFSDMDVRPDLNFLMNFKDAHARSLAEMKAICLTSFLAKVAIAAGNTVSVDASATDGTAPANVKNGFKTIRSNMSAARVDDGIRCMLKPSAYVELVDQDGVVSKDFGTGTDRAFAGAKGHGLSYMDIAITQLGIAFGTDWTSTDTRFDTISMPTEVEADLSNVLGVVWHPDAWCLREQVIQRSSVKELHQTQEWQILSRYHFGVNDLIVSLTNTNFEFGETYKNGIYAILEDTTT